MDKQQQKELELLGECNKYLQANGIPEVSCIHDQLRFRATSVKTHDQDSLLEFMIKEEKFDLAKKLIEIGVFCDLENNKGSTPLIRACFQGNEEIAFLLLARDEVDINHQENTKLASPIIAATIANKPLIVQKLIALEANLSLKDVNHFTVLDHAKSLGSKECLIMIEEALGIRSKGIKKKI